MKVPHAKNPPERATAAATPPPAAAPRVPAARFRQRAFRAGFTQLPNVVLTSQRLSPAAKLAYALLSYFAWQDDQAWPHQNALAAQFGGTDKTLRRALAQLKLLGLLTVERRGLGRTNVYWLEPLDTFAEEEAEWQGHAPASTVETTVAEPAQTTVAEPAQMTVAEPAQMTVAEPAQMTVPLLRKKKTQGNEDSTRSTTANDEAADAARALLRKAGLSPAEATKLVAEKGAEACRQQVEWLPLRRGPRNPAATLKAAIREAWLPPDGNPKLRLPGEKPYVPLAPPTLPDVGPESDAARLKVKAELALRGLASAP